MAVFSAIGAAVAAVSGWFASLGPIATIGLRIGAGLALNALSRLLSGQQDRRRTPGVSGRSRPGITGQIQQGADLPRSFTLGRYATAGSLAYHNSWGTAGGVPNSYYTRVTGWWRSGSTASVWRWAQRQTRTARACQS